MLTVEQKKLLYRAAYRGTKEMDWLVGKFVFENVNDLNAGEMKGLDLLLNLADADIYDLLYGIINLDTFQHFSHRQQENMHAVLRRMQKHHKIPNGQMTRPDR